MQMNLHSLLGSSGFSLILLRMDKGQVTDREGWGLALPVPPMPGPQSPEVGRIRGNDGWGPYLALQAPAPPLQLRRRRKRESLLFQSLIK